MVLYIRGCVNCAGFSKQRVEEGSPRQASDPCHNDADSQSVSPAAPPLPAEVRILHGLYTQAGGIRLLREPAYAGPRYDLLCILSSLLLHPTVLDLDDLGQ